MAQFTTFTLDGRLFGLDILVVREINRILDLTPVPKADPHVRGLINLRGQIVTILDLSVRLGMPRRELQETSHNVILKTDQDLLAQRVAGGPSLSTCSDQVGLLVDDIGDVVDADEGLIEPTSANVSEQEGRFLKGVVKTPAGLLILLDLPALLTA